MKAFHCDMCGQNKSTGYGVDRDTGDRICYRCCGELDRDAMAECEPGDRFMLYLTFDKQFPPPHRETRNPIILRGRTIWHDKGTVSNWPGSLEFDTLRIKEGRHNIAGVRYDTWFQDHTGAWWWGVQFGDWTQVIHCKKLKHPVY